MKLFVADCKVCSVNTGTTCSLDDDCPLGPSGGEICLNGNRQPTCSSGQCVGTCNCYFGPPLPLSSGKVPACVLNRFANDISGTANVDLGSGAITANLKATVFLGTLVTVPCPICGGTCTAGNIGDPCAVDGNCDTSSGAGDGTCANYDGVANDGTRDGTCFLGDNEGQSCDIQSRNETFPSPTGGGHSLDCFPGVGSNVSGTGLNINLVQTTGTQTLTAGLECGTPPFVLETCPCGQCSDDTTITCTANSDCGTCTSNADCPVGFNLSLPTAGTGGLCE